jgi:serine/threonine-protein kinase
MELLEGESLGQRLKRIRRLPVADAVRFARHALLSLAEAHEKGIVHRDLKPDNLFLAQPPPGEQEEVCKVLDFGIAKVMSDGGKSVDALETQAGTVFGTPRYMSPEQAQGRPLDARSDLYSLGVLLYQMLVGRPPFVDDDAVVVMARHIKSTPIPAIEAAPDAGIPRALSDLLQRVLAKSPEERPGTAMAFIEEIERATSDGPPAERERGSEPRAAEVGATGELLAVVGDGLEASQAQGARRASPRSRTALLLAGGAAVALVERGPPLCGPRGGSARGRGPARSAGAGRRARSRSAARAGCPGAGPRAGGSACRARGLRRRRPHRVIPHPAQAAAHAQALRQVRLTGAGPGQRLGAQQAPAHPRPLRPKPPALGPRIRPRGRDSAVRSGS